MNTDEYQIGDSDFDEPYEAWESRETRLGRDLWRPEAERERSSHRSNRLSDLPVGTPDQLQRLAEMVRELFWRRARDLELEATIRGLQKNVAAMQAALYRAGLDEPANDEEDLSTFVEARGLGPIIDAVKAAARDAFGTYSFATSLGNESELGGRFVRVAIGVPIGDRSEFRSRRRQFDSLLERVPSAEKLANLVITASRSGE
jgi:hypothetical protein